MLSAHTFYWFSIPQHAPAESTPTAPHPAPDAPEIWTNRDWERLLDNSGVRQLEAALRQTLKPSEAAVPPRLVRTARVRDAFRITAAESAAYLILVELEFNRGSPETRLVALTYATAETAAAWPPGAGPQVYARVSGAKSGVLYNALSDPAFDGALLQLIARGSTLSGIREGELVGFKSSAWQDLRGTDTELPPATLVSIEQTNSSLRFGNRLVLKAFGRVEEGPHPEPEIGRLLTEDHPVSCVAPYGGSVEYRGRTREPMTLMVVHGFVPNEGDAWQYTLDNLSVFFEHVATLPPFAGELPTPLRRRLGEGALVPPEFASELLNSPLQMVQLLGTRLGELHGGLASAGERPEFAPEPISLQYQRSLYQSLRNILFDVMDNLSRQQARIPAELQEQATQVRKLQGALLSEFRVILERRVHATRIRCHGDCHLHQVLFTGKDFVFIDFEGSPGQSIGERRLKRSPLRDVIGMLRSFDYAAYATLLGLESGRGRATGAIRAADRPALFPWAAAWRAWMHDAFLTGYLAATAGASFIPQHPEERSKLFRVLLLERLLQELTVELTARPTWLSIPLMGLLEAIPRSEVNEES